jgi:osmotically inducible lipoprotein OsmB
VGRTRRSSIASSIPVRRPVAARRRVSGLVALVILSGTLAGCGYSTGDRAGSGALIGAGGGAAIAAMTGGAPLAGAAIGAGAGALGGALTSGNDLNLGRPVWR